MFFKSILKLYKFFIATYLLKHKSIITRDNWARLGFLNDPQHPAYNIHRHGGNIFTPPNLYCTTRRIIILLEQLIRLYLLNIIITIYRI